MGHHNHDVKNIKTAFLLNLGFTIFELIGGLFVNSVAILSDAIHDLGDSLSLGLSWYFQNLSHKGRTKTFSYGYKRFSVLSAIINSIVLLVGSIFILYETIPRLITPVQPNATGMLALSIIGIIVNGAAVLKTCKGKTANERAVSLHMMEDVLGWIAVFIGSVIMYFVHLPILDPILSILITGFILFNAFKNLGFSLKIILQSIPSNVNLDKLKSELLQIDNVIGVHDMHSWSMDGEYHVMTVHLVLNKNTKLKEGEKIKSQARAILKTGEIEHATIELESMDAHCNLHDC
jgi:cobalt-zinc-cadmium efflux system protein